MWLVISGFVVWILAILWHLIRTNHIKFFHFPFSRRNYYIFALNIFLAILITSLIFNQYWLVIAFFIFGIAGIIGEIGFSYLWNSIFKKKIWIYEEDPIFNKYSSILNLLPWSGAGFLFVLIGQRLEMQTVITETFETQFLPIIIIFISSLVLSLLIAYIAIERRKINFELKSLNFWTYSLFCLPFLTFIAFLTSIDYRFFVLALTFGLVAFAAEYLLGKMIKLFISKQLWYYGYATLDKKHTTLLNIIPFSFAGFYFWTIYILFLNFLCY